jgi:NAD(P)H dehydrogenase (quinone)
MSYVITGATGHLGRLVIEAMLQGGVPAQDITAAGRDLTKIKDLADQGVQTRGVDYDDPAILRTLFSGGAKVLLVSGSEVGNRVPQHRNVINAAADAGVSLLAYTSIPKADTTTMLLAQEHQATEQALIASGVPYVLLRNSWYLENYTDRLPVILEHGVLPGSAGDGRVSAAARADYALAAAEVLTTEGHEGRAYELGSDQAFTLAELAAEISAQTGHDISYLDLPEQEYAQVLIDAGIPEPSARILADADRGLARGDLYVGTGHLRQLAGRPATSLHDAVSAALR